MSLSGDWKHPKHKGGARFVLLIADLYQKDEKPCGVRELIEETGMSKHQILRIIEDLKTSGVIVAEGGRGRAPYIIRLASANEAKMDTQEGGSDSKKSTNKMESQAEPEECSDAKMASLADAAPLWLDKAGGSDSILSGTEVAPSKAETTNKKESQATLETAGQAPADATDWGEIGRERQKMLDALKSALGVGVLSALQAERATCNWLLKNRSKLNATTEDFIECMREQAEEVESGSGRRKVSWMTVKSEFSAWQLRARGGVKHGERNQPRQSSKPSREETYHGYDYSPLDGAAGEGVGRLDSEVPPDEWLEPAAAGRPVSDDRRMARSSGHLRRTG